MSAEEQNPSPAAVGGDTSTAPLVGTKSPRVAATVMMAPGVLEEDGLPRPRSRSRVPFSRDMMTVALHVYNARGVKNKNTREETREWHYKENRARTTVGKCKGCSREIDLGEFYYLNYPFMSGTHWSQGVDPRCEVCMGLLLRKELGQDDEAIKQELELIKKQNPGTECLIC